MKKTFFIIGISFLLSFAAGCIQCDCADECEELVIVHFNTDPVIGFSDNELDTVYFFTFDKISNVQTDSFCLLNGEYGTSGYVYCYGGFSLPEGGKNFLIKTKTDYEYFIRNIVIESEYSRKQCHCIESTHRSFDMNGLYYEANGRNDDHYNHVVLSKY